MRQRIGDYNRLLEAEARGYDFFKLQTSSLEDVESSKTARARYIPQGGGDVYCNGKESVEIDLEEAKRMCREEITKNEGRDTNPHLTCSFHKWKRRNIYGQDSTVQAWTCGLDDLHL